MQAQQAPESCDILLTVRNETDYLKVEIFCRGADSWREAVERFAARLPDCWGGGNVTYCDGSGSIVFHVEHGKVTEVW